MAHGHHGSTLTITGRYLGLATILTMSFVAIEAIGGLLANSLALLADAAHNFVDGLFLVLSWYAIYIARRPSSERRTFGFHRAGILAALVNSASLVVIAGWIFWEAIHRILHPEPVSGGPMMIIALVAIVLNTVIALALRPEAKHDLNIRSAYIHLIADTVSSLGVVLLGVIVSTTGYSIVDPIGSILIGLLIVWSSWGIIKESIDVLLESTPPGVDVKSLEQALRNEPGVRDMHDLHVWTIGTGMIALTCHIVIEDQTVSSAQAIHSSICRMLEERFAISHVTLQMEVEGCESNDLFCTMRAIAAPHQYQHCHGGHCH